MIYIHGMVFLEKVTVKTHTHLHTLTDTYVYINYHILGGIYDFFSIDDERCMLWDIQVSRSLTVHDN